jgi:hypothetical protein
MTHIHEVAYEYSRGNLLEKRNTYFYTPFYGKAFLKAWRHSRQLAIAELPEAQPLEFKKVLFHHESEDVINTDRLLNYLGDLLSEGESEPSEYKWALINRLVMKFEVSKRIYQYYTKDFQPVNKAGYKHMELYVQFVAVMSIAYQKTAGLPYLNVMIKCIDTLISYRERLRSNEAAALADLINREYNYVATLAEKVEVRL